MKITMVARMYCDECTEYFEFEIPLEVLPVTLNSEIEMHLPGVIDKPEGWRIHNRHVLCPKHNPNVEKEMASQEIIERARRLQTLAMDKGAKEGEKANAWTEFGKLWNKYNLPPEFGLEE